MTVFGMVFERHGREFPVVNGASLAGQALRGNPADPRNNVPCVPKTLTSGNAKRGLFTGQDFICDAEKDHYTCPAGEHLTRGLVRSTAAATSTTTAI